MAVFDPTSANITSSNGITYTFTGNNYLPIQVQRSNIVIDGSGYTLQGWGAGSDKGIQVYYMSDAGQVVNLQNVTIKNMKIKGFDYAITIEYSFNCKILNNVLTENVWTGIGIYAVALTPTQFTISGNTITNNKNGIYLQGLFKL